MVVNYRLGKIGNVEWTRDWDRYLFLNSSLENEFVASYLRKNKESIVSVSTKSMAPPTDLSEYFKNEVIYGEKLRLIRHSSQGDTKYPKNFNQIVGRILDEVKDVEIHLMPAPSFLAISDPRVFSYKRNQPSVVNFLEHGNCFWYILPEGYHDQGPKVIMEAQASGLPVIADNHSGAVDRVGMGNGYLCNNIDEHIEAMKLMNDPNVRKLFGENARKKAEKDYHPDLWIEEIIG